MSACLASASDGWLIGVGVVASRTPKELLTICIRPGGRAECVAQLTKRHTRFIPVVFTEPVVVVCPQKRFDSQVKQRTSGKVC